MRNPVKGTLPFLFDFFIHVGVILACMWFGYERVKRWTSMTVWQFVDGGNQTNSALAASGSEVINFSDAKDARGFNALTVTNRDNTDIRILLNGQNKGGRVMVVPAGSEKSIPQENGEVFDFIKVENLDTANAMTAGAVQYVAGRYVKVG